MIQDMESDFFKTQLQTRGDVAIATSQRCVRQSRWPKRVSVFIRKQATDFGRAAIPGHVHTFRRVTKIIEVQAKLTVPFCSHYFTKLIDKAWLSIRRESHHFSFVAVMRKPKELRRCGINDPQRVWILDLTKHLD